MKKLMIAAAAAALFSTASQAAIVGYYADASNITGPYGFTGTFTLDSLTGAVTDLNIIDTLTGTAAFVFTPTSETTFYAVDGQGQDMFGSLAINGVGKMTYSGDSATTGPASYNGAFTVISYSEVPVPAAAWLFGSALVGLAGVKRRK